MTLCPCDERIHPPLPDIPAGLDRLPRQLAGFPEYRLALLAGIRGIPALDDWRAREGDDFGVMVLEWWAYVLDVLSFYTGEIANEMYLRTAVREASLRRLTELIGYTPKPPLAASATLALTAEPGQAVFVPAGTAFRSDAFDEEAPQIYETGADADIAASLNEWVLAPIRDGQFGGGPLLLDPRTASVAENQLVVLDWGDFLHAAKARSVTTRRMLDGESYVELGVDPVPSIPANQAVAEIDVSTLALRAALNPFFGRTAVSRGGGHVVLILDALYGQIRTGSVALLERTDTGQVHAARVDAVGLRSNSLGGRSEIFGDQFTQREESLQFIEQAFPISSTEASGPAVQVTRVVLDGNGPNWIDTADVGALTLHFAPVTAGRVVRPGKVEIGLADLQASAALVGPVEPLQLETHSRVLLWDALEAGASLAANVTDDNAGTGTLTPEGNAEPFDHPLRTPVSVLGNLVDVTRGESVEEVLGNGDATQSFQRFRLKKKPLTYLSSLGSATGRKSTLEIWVEGVRWKEISSQFFAEPGDRVYTVRQTVDGETEITFGDGISGQRLPTGNGNVRAKYRYGAGAARPPAGGIRNLARTVKGVRRALNPLAAFGGDDGDKASDIRTAAPHSALSLGRAISLIDFEAIARGYRGILNAAARTAWDEREQRAAVKLWFIPPNDDEAQQLRVDLEAHLRTIAAPGTPITVDVATADPHTLSVDFTVASDRDEAEVKTASLALLTDDQTGMLARRNVPIGGPIFRGDILAAVRGVDGVDEVRGLLLDNGTAPFAIVADEGEYLTATVNRTG